MKRTKIILTDDKRHRCIVDAYDIISCNVSQNGMTVAVVKNQQTGLGETSYNVNAVSVKHNIIKIEYVQVEEEIYG